jgi:hypothetical protein
MKWLKAILCVLTVLLVLQFTTEVAQAELPWTKEIKDLFMWGDPDCPWSRKKHADPQPYPAGPADGDPGMKSAGGFVGSHPARVGPGSETTQVTGCTTGYAPAAFRTRNHH